MQYAAPIAVAALHLVIALVCAWYDWSLLSGLAGLITFAALFASLGSMVSCIVAGPGYVSKPVVEYYDAESPEQRGMIALPNQAWDVAPLEMASLSLGRHSEIVQLDESFPDDQMMTNRDRKHTDLRFCNTCSVYQPVRAKHCLDCNKCVRTYDHHCPWIGTCVGERNRCRFLIYLLSEFFAISWFMGNGIAHVHGHSGERDKIAAFAFLIMAVTVMSVFWLMTGVLGGYHLFLAAASLTTWEHSSWHRISYLSELRPENGSPFSRPTVWQNLKLFCSSGDFVEWDVGVQQQPFPKFMFKCFCDCD